MKTRNKVLTIVAMTAVLGGAAVTGISIAHDRGGYGKCDGPRHGDDFGEYRGGRHGSHHGKHGRKGHHDRGERMQRLMQKFDSNRDGTLTQEEVNQVRVEQLQKFDSNSDGQLSLQEFQAMWLEKKHNRMVDRFQDLDEDGDAVVSLAEFQAPFEHLAKHVEKRKQRGERHKAKHD